MGVEHFSVLVKYYCGARAFFKLTADSFQQRLNLIPR